MSNSGLNGRTAVVTGGASGIGETIVERLRQDGARVAVLDLDVPTGIELAYHADVSDRGSVMRAIAAVTEITGGIDVVVNNAGIGATGDASVNSDDEWARVLSVNVTSIARLTAATLPWLRRSDSPSICNIASIAATTGIPDRALYSATKGAVLALTRAMAADYVREGIRVNAVNPGTVDTAWLARLLAQSEDPAADRQALRARQPHGRFVSRREVADAVAYLVSPNSGSTTGTFLEVDGGMASLRLPELRPARDR